jgi:hypothetical protein
MFKLCLSYVGVMPSWGLRCAPSYPHSRQVMVQLCCHVVLGRGWQAVTPAPGHWSRSLLCPLGPPVLGPGGHSCWHGSRPGEAVLTQDKVFASVTLPCVCVLWRARGLPGSGAVLCRAGWLVVCGTGWRVCGTGWRVCVCRVYGSGGVGFGPCLV